MSTDAVEDKRKKIRRLTILLGIVALLVFANASVLMESQYSYSSRASIVKGVSNCRQICMALHLYAADHDGKYPDAGLQAPENANEVFRELFKSGVIDDEAIFGCPVSPFEPDGIIKSGEDGNKVLEAGENHWAMTRGLTVRNEESIPLVYENPATATWPPVWDPSASGAPKRGRAWSTGIIVGLNDGSAQIQPLASKKGSAVGLKVDWIKGKNLFEAAIDPKDFPKGEVLDVEILYP